MSQDDVIRRVDVGNDIVTEYHSASSLRQMSGFAARNADRSFAMIRRSLRERRFGAARLWLKYAALRVSLLRGRALRSRSVVWLDFVVRLAHASLAAAQP
jgi:hypothetical protein